MLIPAKSHSCTFYQHDRSQITSGGMKGGAIAGRCRCWSGPHCHLRTIDRHSGQWRARDVAKQPVEGYVERATGEAQWPISPGRQTGESPLPRWTVNRAVASLDYRKSTNWNSFPAIEKKDWEARLSSLINVSMLYCFCYGFYWPTNTSFPKPGKIKVVC